MKKTAALTCPATQQFVMFHKMQNHMQTQPSGDLGTKLSLVGTWTLKNPPLGIKVLTRHTLKAMQTLIDTLPTLRAHLVSHPDGSITVEFSTPEACGPAKLATAKERNTHFQTTTPGLKARISCYRNQEGHDVFQFEGSHLILDGPAAVRTLTLFAKKRIEAALEDTFVSATVIGTLAAAKKWVPAWIPLVGVAGLIATRNIFKQDPIPVEGLINYALAQDNILQHTDFTSDLKKYCDAAPPRSFSTSAAGLKESRSGEPGSAYYPQQVYTPGPEMAQILNSKNPDLTKLTQQQLGKYVFMAAVQAVTGESPSIREQRMISEQFRDLPPHYASCAWLSSMPQDKADYSLINIHAHMKIVRDLNIKFKEKGSGPFEMVPPEAGEYLDALNKINPDYDPHEIIEYNPVGKVGDPASPLWEHHAAITIDRALQKIGLGRGTSIEGKIDFGEWDGPAYGPEISAAGIITTQKKFEIRVSTRQNSTEPELAKAIGEAMDIIMKNWAQNPTMKISEMNIPRFRK